MRDPHVVWLKYRAEHKNESRRFENPSTLITENDKFKITLANGELTAEMKGHYATEGDARGVVERCLRSWEIDVGLTYGAGTMLFTFQNVHIVDRNPPVPGEVSVGEGSIIRCLVAIRPRLGLMPTITHVHACYTPPPERFLATPDVESLWHRYQMYRQGREPLLTMAYFCLSLLEGTTGNNDGSRKSASNRYEIDNRVLSELGRITAKRGDSKEARKYGHEATRTPLTESEKYWVEEVILALIRRKGEYDFDPSASLPQITMSNFSPLRKA
jgi:hypothetical protein